MKVLFMTNIPSPYRIDFFNELGKYCDLTVTFERTNASDREKNWANLDEDSYNFKAVFLKGIKISNDSAFCYGICDIIKNGQFDNIVVGMYSTFTSMLAILYMKIHKISFVLNTDGGFVKSDNYIVKNIKKYFISSAAMWLTSGKESIKYLTHYGASSNNIYTYPFTSVKKVDVIDKLLSEEEKNIYKDKINVSEDIMILSVGQFIYRKGYDILFEACRDLKGNVGIYIVGGNPTDEYVDIVNKLGLKNIHFVGFKDSKELSDYYKASDIFVLPTREDIWGLVVNEAMSYGLPIITTNKCNAGIELIENEVNGYIVDVNDYSALREKMQLLISDNILRYKISKANILKINSHTIEEMALVHWNVLSGNR